MHLTDPHPRLASAGGDEILYLRMLREEPQQLPSGITSGADDCYPKSHRSYPKASGAYGSELATHRRRLPGLNAASDDAHQLGRIAQRVVSGKIELPLHVVAPHFIVGRRAREDTHFEAEEIAHQGDRAPASHRIGRSHDVGYSDAHQLTVTKDVL